MRCSHALGRRAILCKDRSSLSISRNFYYEHFRINRIHKHMLLNRVMSYPIHTRLPWTWLYRCQNIIIDFPVLTAKRYLCCPSLTELVVHWICLCPAMTRASMAKSMTLAYLRTAILKGPALTVGSINENMPCAMPDRSFHHSCCNSMVVVPGRLSREVFFEPITVFATARKQPCLSHILKLIAGLYAGSCFR